jgi:hypothetical protein
MKRKGHDSTAPAARTEAFLSGPIFSVIPTEATRLSPAHVFCTPGGVLERPWQHQHHKDQWHNHRFFNPQGALAS